MQEVRPYAEPWPLNADVVIRVPFPSFDIDIKGFAAFICGIGISTVTWCRHIHIEATVTNARTKIFHIVSVSESGGVIVWRSEGIELC